MFIMRTRHPRREVQPLTLPPPSSLQPCAYASRVTYATERHAGMVAAALSVDTEASFTWPVRSSSPWRTPMPRCPNRLPPSPTPQLHPKHVSKSIVASGCDVVVNFRATDPKMLRGAVGTFTDLMGLATRSIEQFDSK